MMENKPETTTRIPRTIKNGTGKKAIQKNINKAHSKQLIIIFS